MAVCINQARDQCTVEKFDTSLPVHRIGYGNIQQPSAIVERQNPPAQPSLRGQDKMGR